MSAAGNAALFWHVYAINHWFDVAAETLLCLRRAGWPFPVHAHVVGQTWDVSELEALAGEIGVRVDATHHAENAYEFPTLAALWRHCQAADAAGQSVPVFYIHTKAVSRTWPTYSRWRWMMAEQVLHRWRDRLTDLETADAVGCCHRPDWPCFAGNWWAARADWIRSLPEPRRSRDRFAFERWVLCRPGARVKALVSTGGEPCQPGYYARNGQPHRAYLDRLK